MSTLENFTEQFTEKLSTQSPLWNTWRTRKICVPTRVELSNTCRLCLWHWPSARHVNQSKQVHHNSFRRDSLSSKCRNLGTIVYWQDEIRTLCTWAVPVADNAPIATDSSLRGASFVYIGVQCAVPLARLLGICMRNFSCDFSGVGIIEEFPSFFQIGMWFALSYSVFSALTVVFNDMVKLRKSRYENSGVSQFLFSSLKMKLCFIYTFLYSLFSGFVSLRKI